MNEKIIIKGKTSKINILTIINLILAVVPAITGWTWINEYYIAPGNYAFKVVMICVITFALCIASAILSYLIMNNCEIIVSDKRVSGKIKFGIKVDLPLNQISSVGQGLFKSLTVATSSGVIRFWLIENREDVVSEITKLLSQLQNSQNNVQHNDKSSNADELKKIKELLDSGVITQEEFDVMKK